jgi:hypothetical protein
MAEVREASCECLLCLIAMVLAAWYACDCIVEGLVEFFIIFQLLSNLEPRSSRLALHLRIQGHVHGGTHRLFFIFLLPSFVLIMMSVYCLSSLSS